MSDGRCARACFAPSWPARASGGAALLLTLLAGVTANGQPSRPSNPLPVLVTVNSAGDPEVQQPGEVTLRAALASVRSGGRVTFAPELSGREILLTRVGETNTVLVGESFPSGVFAGFVARDYGRSALAVRKNVTLDAAALPLGVTLRWAGGPAAPARVLAVYGNVTLKNIAIAGGRSVAEARADSAQPFTLARGGGLAVWGTATLDACTFYDNAVKGDEAGSRDRGAFGGAVYGNRLILTDCLIAGNSAVGFGAAGGGVYSVGGVNARGGSSLTRCVVAGNLAEGQHAYGGGVYTDGGGPGKSMTLTLANCTVARNRVADNPEIGENPFAQYYCRGGGVYMSNGSLRIDACTIVENVVTGVPAVFRGRPNLGGGGIAATIGDAHVVESVQLTHSIVAGNTVNAAGNDLYTGSLLHVYSGGYNLAGVLDTSQLLAPVPLWLSLHRRHWPAAGDAEGVALDEVVDRGAAVAEAAIRSAGVAAGEPVVLAYPPRGAALNRIPPSYRVPVVYAQWRSTAGARAPGGEVLAAVVARYRRLHPEVPLPDFGDLGAIRFVAESRTWPSLAENAAWIGFWRRLDAALAEQGVAHGLDDAFWSTFKAMPNEGPVAIRVSATTRTVSRQRFDQLGRSRTASPQSDIGAVEAP